MNSFLKTTLVFFALTVLICAQKEQTINKSFENISKITIDFVLGDCEIVKTKSDKVDVKLTYSYDNEDFEAIIEERNGKLYLEEEFYDGRRNYDNGDSKWIIGVPDDIDIEFESATGNLKVVGLSLKIDGNSGTGNLLIEDSNGEFELNSGTGDLMIVKSKGDFNLNSGTGNVEVKESIGKFEANSGTGDVEFKKVNIAKRSSLNSGTGDVYVSVNSKIENDLELNSGTGDATLNMSGQKLDGKFYFSCNEDRGTIESPVAFDEETETREHGHYVLRKHFTKGSSNVEIKISTGTGTAELELK